MFKILIKKSTVRITALFRSGIDMLQGRAGLTLIEVFVALVIFSLASLMLAYTITSSMRQDLKNTLRDQGYTLLNSTANRLKSREYDNLSTYEDNVTIPINNKLDYNYQVICEVEEPNFDNVSDAIKKITIDVLWPKPHRTKEGETDNISAIFYKRKRQW